jgi:methyl coenzyme M reductase subunit C-like uncharacterized protein (methanogenesis marker protein 7)
MVLTVLGQVSLTARAPTEVVLVQLVPTSGHLHPRWCDRQEYRREHVQRENKAAVYANAYTTPHK